MRRLIFGSTLPRARRVMRRTGGSRRSGAPVCPRRGRANREACAVIPSAPVHVGTVNQASDSGLYVSLETGHSPISPEGRSRHLHQCRTMNRAARRGSLRRRRPGRGMGRIWTLSCASRHPRVSADKVRRGRLSYFQPRDPQGWSGHIAARTSVARLSERLRCRNGVLPRSSGGSPHAASLSATRHQTLGYPEVTARWSRRKIAAGHLCEPLVSAHLRTA